MKDKGGRGERSGLNNPQDSRLRERTTDGEVGRGERNRLKIIMEPYTPPLYLRGVDDGG
jgi:hypothetical protein